MKLYFDTLFSDAKSIPWYSIELKVIGYIIKIIRSRQMVSNHFPEIHKQLLPRGESSFWTSYCQYMGIMYQQSSSRKYSLHKYQPTMPLTKIIRAQRHYPSQGLCPLKGVKRSDWSSYSQHAQPEPKIKDQQALGI